MARTTPNASEGVICLTRSEALRIGLALELYHNLVDSGICNPPANSYMEDNPKVLNAWSPQAHTSLRMRVEAVIYDEKLPGGIA